MKGVLSVILLAVLLWPREGHVAVATYEIKTLGELFSISTAVVRAKEYKKNQPPSIALVIKEILFSKQQGPDRLQTGSKITVGTPLPLSDSFLTEHGVVPSNKASTIPIFGNVEPAKSEDHEVIVFLNFHSGWHLSASGAVLSLNWLSKVNEAIRSRTEN